MDSVCPEHILAAFHLIKSKNENIPTFDFETSDERAHFEKG